MNSSLAMPAAPAATPVKPRAPASREMTAKMMAYLSMVFSLEAEGAGQCAGDQLLR
ncbi:hypothetical protein D3C78_1970530 [compost metagenome]